jgi:hypothetical protein
MGGAVVGLGTTYAYHGPGPELLLAAALFVIVLARHAGNVQRLARGEEPPG